MDKTLRTLTTLAVCAALLACSTFKKQDGSGAVAGSGGGGGAGGTGTTDASVANAGTTGGSAGASGVGAVDAATSGAGGASGTGSAYCDSQTPKMLPFHLITGGAYVPSGWFPATGPDDMKAIPCAGTAAAVGEDAGTAPPTSGTCQGVRYKQANAANTFAGINWQPNDKPTMVPVSCFKGVTGVEFWVSGTPGATVNFEAQGSKMPVVLTAAWKMHTIPITGMDSSGQAVAFTVGFSADPAVTGPGPVYVYYADPTYVGN